MSALGTDLSPIPCVGLCVQKLHCGKMADWIQMPFGVISRFGRGMGVLDEVHMPHGMGRFPEFFAPIGLNGVF